MPRPPWSRLAQHAAPSVEQASPVSQLAGDISRSSCVCDLERGKAECEQAGHLDSGWGINGKTLRSLLMRNPKVLGYKID